LPEKKTPATSISNTRNQGDDDQIVLIGASALLSFEIVKGATVTINAGAPHGLRSIHKDQVNAELFGFVRT
jgi:non-heme chloroperoxidase